MPLYAAQTKGKSIVTDGKATFADPDGIEVADLLEDPVRRGPGRQGDLPGRLVRRQEGRHGRSSVRGPSRSTRARSTGARCRCRPRTALPAAETWTFSDAKNVGLYLGLQEPGHRLGGAEVRHQRGAGRRAAGQDRADAAAQGPADRYADYFTKNKAYQTFGDQASRTVEVPAGPHTVEMLQTLRDAYTKTVISGEGDLTTEFTAAADKVTELAGQK